MLFYKNELKMCDYDLDVEYREFCLEKWKIIYTYL